MSLWLSGANKIAGSARAQLAATAKRQLNVWVSPAAKVKAKSSAR
jgi:hypothetical protein